MNDNELVEQARVKRTSPSVSRESGQRSLQVSAPFFYRWLPQWKQPDWLGAERWRGFVQAQPVAVDCREAIINNTLALAWKISPRDSTRLDELSPLIEYYTNFLSHTGEYEFADIVEWILKDYLDLPFGSGTEVGREGDRPDGKVRWIRLLDGGTLFPTRNTQYPVGQSMPSDVQHPVFFPAHAINRLYMSPRTEFMRTGWGMPPPEKIYLAIELISRGDQYYSKLLLDTPEAGLLDLINMSKSSAETWIDAFRSYMQGVDPFNIPVLYEHDQPAKWIPFGRPPTELMFDRVTLKYAAMVCSGYGLTLSDIGFSSSTSGGDTLAGSIRQERTSKKQGFSKAKQRTQAWFNRLIDPTQTRIKFEWVDLDDEFAIAQGRARLANATAMQQMVDGGIISPQESRLQLIADRTFTISMPEKLPPDAQKKLDILGKSPERPGMLGAPVSPSQGGHGEVLPRSKFEDTLYQIVSVPDIKLKRLANAVLPISSTLINRALDELSPNEMNLWSNWQHEVLWGNIEKDIPELTFTLLDSAKKKLEALMQSDAWWEVFSEPADLIDEISTMIWEVHAEDSYVCGKSNSLEVKVNKAKDIKLRKLLKTELARLNLELKSGVQTAIIDGTNRYLAKLGEKLDETLKIDDNLINDVRSQLMFLYENTLNDFGKKLQEIMESK
jgi:hypothetical protein